jgi:hypothetical protein
MFTRGSPGHGVRYTRNDTGHGKLLYRDRPMDFADATLVHLAERESLITVFTIDHLLMHYTVVQRPELVKPRPTLRKHP